MKICIRNVKNGAIAQCLEFFTNRKINPILYLDFEICSKNVENGAISQCLGIITNRKINPFLYLTTNRKIKYVRIVLQITLK